MLQGLLSIFGRKAAAAPPPAALPANSIVLELAGSDVSFDLTDDRGVGIAGQKDAGIQDRMHAIALRCLKGVEEGLRTQGRIFGPNHDGLVLTSSAGLIGADTIPSDSFVSAPNLLREAAVLVRKEIEKDASLRGRIDVYTKEGDDCTPAPYPFTDSLAGERVSTRLDLSVP